MSIVKILLKGKDEIEFLDDGGFFVIMYQNHVLHRCATSVKCAQWAVSILGADKKLQKWSSSKNIDGKKFKIDKSKVRKFILRDKFLLKKYKGKI